MSQWTPILPDSPAPLYDRLTQAMEDDIAAGRLAPGAQLPPQRELAYALNISVGSVTRAYAEGARRGLLTAHVGRGSFVAEQAGARSAAALLRDTGAGAYGLPSLAPLDLTQNVPPIGPARRRLRDAFVRLQTRPDFLDSLTYAPPGGAPEHRRSLAAWVSQRTGFDLGDGAKLLLCVGAQMGLSLAFQALCRPGDGLLCEAAAYYGVRSLARLQGLPVTGLPLDDEGVVPEALDRAAASGAGRVVYLIPTLQNPTGRTMSRQRRADIVKVARRRDLMIVEDDVYGFYAGGDRPEPLAALAPERVFYVSSLSKILAPGLRLGFVLPPSSGRFAETIRDQISATIVTQDAFGGLIADQWIKDGVADQIAAEVIDEVAARADLARQVLGPAVETASGGPCLHLWLPMSELEAERAAGRALRAGLRLTPPNACLVAPHLISGLRLCVGAAADRASLEAALHLLRQALYGDPRPDGMMV